MLHHSFSSLLHPPYLVHHTQQHGSASDVSKQHASILSTRHAVHSHSLNLQYNLLSTCPGSTHAHAALQACTIHHLVCMHHAGLGGYAPWGCMPCHAHLQLLWCHGLVRHPFGPLIIASWFFLAIALVQAAELCRVFLGVKATLGALYGMSYGSVLGQTRYRSR